VLDLLVTCLDEAGTLGDYAAIKDVTIGAINAARSLVEVAEKRFQAAG